LRLSENRVLRRTFGPKRDEVTGVWRKLHEELRNLYSSPSNHNYQVKEDDMGRVGSTNEENRNGSRILVERPEVKRPLGRTRHRWVDNINTRMSDNRRSLVW
jgi:hypothetical protein